MITTESLYLLSRTLESLRIPRDSSAEDEAATDEAINDGQGGVWKSIIFVIAFLQEFDIIAVFEHFQEVLSSIYQIFETQKLSIGSKI